MRFLSRAFWTLAFVAATFCWMVLFQHGFNLAAFQQGAGQEWERILTLVGSSPAAPAPAAAPAAQP
jgi:hypothetical protein